ncbi:DUF948 domain-containing protein [Alteribacter aurantiacus]|uniref:DUF948 domain-containing protein n=1 Tax=Alteribacter aurantiacus TaxID=254410 RepID=UPI0004254BBA|nr:DUF948 domain-containing protein [Alteribacter aurantiacus]
MDFLGIGVLIFALAFAGLVVYLAKVLSKLTDVLTHTAKTVENLEGQIGELTSETKLTLYNTNETIADVNHKLSQLDPIFHIVNDVGESAHRVTTSLVKMSKRTEKDVNKGSVKLDEKDIRGWMRTASFVYYLVKKRKEKKAVKQHVKKNHEVDLEVEVANELQREHMNV